MALTVRSFSVHDTDCHNYVEFIALNVALRTVYGTASYVIQCLGTKDQKIFKTVNSNES